MYFYNPYMFFLASFLPGKTGVLFRKISLIFFLLFLIYMYFFITTIYSLKLKVVDVSEYDNKVNIEFRGENNSYFNIQILNVDFINKKGVKVNKEKFKSVTIIPNIILFFNTVHDIDDYKKYEITIKSMFIKFTIKNPINK